jgi:alkylhydroperoxidase family enzyme
MWLATLLASQINGSSPCVDGGAMTLRRRRRATSGCSPAWRETDLFTDAEGAGMSDRLSLSQKVRAPSRV